jgi:hypothetical protein
LTVTLSLLLLAGCGASSGLDVEARPPSGSSGPAVSQADPAVAVRAAFDVATYAADVARVELADAVGTYLASIPPPVPPTAVGPNLPSVPAVGVTPTGACGGATNGADRYIGRESGGNPGIYNSEGSGAWGCYQIEPGTWEGAGCDAFGSYGSANAQEQAECASRLPLSAWGG